jgi:hypothetical protein
MFTGNYWQFFSYKANDGSPKQQHGYGSYRNPALTRRISQQRPVPFVGCWTATTLLRSSKCLKERLPDAETIGRQR